ncbi:zinc/manganese transport system permease protein [Actinomadura coerulea]|uniref:Zinc/manganese transport system permease protein n=1 Tax=Actinomadura coerulea TaxID=46159 RepID=A0A7X0KYX2_9ACTN|nr:metal ABC transporter permease [Actinomadura coerulea]MBB6395866.1 zinc/manganese transport system permease protein [Actinomadura coerulea]GGQ46898.1 helicase [Actinomadura coerulea]
MSWQEAWHEIFNFRDYGALLGLVRNSLVAGAVLGLVGGLAGTFVVMRDLAFAVHGISELSFAGAAAALLAGASVAGGSIAGALVAAGLIGVLGAKARDRGSAIGVLMPFGLGLGVLFLSLYQGRSANKFGILTGQIVAIDTPRLSWLLATSAVVLACLAVMWRPLAFASLDPDVAAARGVPVRALSPAFLLVLGLAVAVSVQVVGALLVLALLCTPAAAAVRVTASPVLAPVLSAALATVSVLGGILLSIGSSIPISPYVTTVSFLLYGVCRAVGAVRARRGWTARGTRPGTVPT